MKYGLNIPQNGELDIVSLGALVHRLDPGIVPFRKATNFEVHVSGGEFYQVVKIILLDQTRQRKAKNSYLGYGLLAIQGETQGRQRIGSHDAHQ